MKIETAEHLDAAVRLLNRKIDETADRIEADNRAYLDRQRAIRDQLDSSAEREPPVSDCQHVTCRILTYNAGPYRWIEQCKECGEVRYVTMDNEIIPVPTPPERRTAGHE
jgi:hypothetical protein